MSEDCNGPGRWDFESTLTAIVDDLDQRHFDGGGRLGVDTGFHDLDDQIGGLQPGRLYLIAGRPGMGASSIIRNIAANCTTDPGVSALLFVNQATALETSRHLLVSEALVDAGRFFSADLEDGERVRVEHACERLAERDVVIIDHSPTVQALARTVCHQRRQLKANVVVLVDSLDGLFSEHPTGWESRSLEQVHVVQSLHALARELSIPVVVTVPVHRDVESRIDKRPLMGDLRACDPDTLVSAADVVVSLYRDEMYDERSSEKGVAEFIVLKNRTGPCGTARLAFRGHYLRFDSLARAFSGKNVAKPKTRSQARERPKRKPKAEPKSTAEPVRSKSDADSESDETADRPDPIIPLF